ncbi:MAG TPA: type I polyketide synthase [Polyangiaceae bacterium]|nr:type I polyketide synthase [Polyangiaceae bacterium]
MGEGAGQGGPQGPRGNEIAIVGLAGRFPRSEDLDAFWRNLRDGVELVTFYGDDELAARGVDPALLRDPSFVKAASTLERLEEFDAAFFGLLPREAAITDPQHRLLLECAWEALEHAGYDPARLGKPVGVYVGAAMNGYLALHLVGNPRAASAGYVALQLANDKDYLPTRISYKLDLRGPSLLVQSACSTSLVALHVAAQSLLNHECDLALAGGVAGLVHNREGYQHVEGGIFSPDGHCRSFDADGRGTVFGSGAGLAVLKRLPDALADGDTVHAVVIGSAVNNDGSAKVGYTAPSVEGQAEVIAEALANAGVSAESISYVEGHGTATQLGDPIELQALAKAFRSYTERRRFCALGSVKSNLGHLDAAAGIAGVIKTVLALRHRQIPPSLHFTTPNPRVDWERSPFFVNASLRDWPSEGGPRRAGVSSFGIGGTNAHVVLEEAPPPAPTSPARPSQLLLLSARTPSARAAMASRLADHLERHPELDLADVAYTLQVGRRAFPERLALLCAGRDDAVRALREADPRRAWVARQEQQDRPVVFLFPGQGAQRVNMGRGLYEREPAFRKQVDACAERLRPHLGLDLREALYPPGGGSEDDERRLRQTRLAQPALFVTEYALARLWMSWGVRPAAMIGHSVGEFVAACLAGLFSLDDALALVAARGRLADGCPPGAMLSVALPAAEVRAALAPPLCLAAINAPAQCVVSGPADAVDALEEHLTRARGARCRRLPVSHAFHSSMLEPMLEPFAEALRRVAFQAPRLPWVSNLTGTWVTPAEAASPGYWLSHLRETVNFADGVGEILKDPGRVLLEVGPGQALGALAREHGAHTEAHTVLASAGRREGPPDDEQVAAAVGRLWLAGVTIDWPAVYAKQRRRRVPLPTYPFERKRHWVDAVRSPWAPSAAARPAGRADDAQAALGRPSADAEVALERPPADVDATGEVPPPAPTFADAPAAERAFDGPPPSFEPTPPADARPNAHPDGVGRASPPRAADAATPPDVGEPAAPPDAAEPGVPPGAAEPAAPPAAALPGGLATLMAEQLRVLSLQLAVLRRQRPKQPRSR